MAKKITTVILSCIILCTSIYAQNCSVNAGVSITWCPSETMSLFGNVTGLYTGSTITWSQVSGPAVTITNTNSLTTTCGTATAGATYVFRISATCQDNSTVTNDVTYTVVAATPTPPAADAGATINAGCLQWGGTINLNAVAATPGFIGTWSIVSGGQGSFSNVNSPTSTFTPIQQSPANPNWVCPTNSNSYVLKWTLVSTTPPPPQCPSAQTSNSANLTINVAMWNPVDARAITPGCGNPSSDVQLYGTCRGTGTSQWTLISGPAGYTFTPNTSQNVTLTNPPNGNYTFRYTVTGTAPCPTGTKDVTFSVTQGSNFAVTVSNANAGNVKTGTCNSEPFPSSIQLSANLPNVGETGTWSQVGGGTTVAFSNINSNTSTVSGMTAAGSPYTFRWTITNSLGCTSYSDIVFRMVLPFTPNPINLVTGCSFTLATGGGTSFCNSTTKAQLANLTNTNIPQAQGWYLSGYYLNSKPAGSTIPLGYKPNVLFISNYLGVQGNTFSEAADPTCAAHGIIIGLSKGNNNSTSLPYQIYVYLQLNQRNFTGAYSGELILKNENCDITYAIPFSFSVTRDVSNSNAGTDQNLTCDITQTNLAGNDPLLTPPNYGTGTWQQISGPNSAVIADVNNRSTLISSLIPGTYSFSWMINSGTVCPPRVDTVLVRVSDTIPSDITAGVNQTVCFGTPITLTADLIPSGNLANMLLTTGSIGTWSLVSQTPAGTAPTIVTPNGVSTNITGLLASTVYVFRYTASNLCGSKTADVTITTTATQGPSQADAGINQCLAVGGAITLNATVPTSGTGVWTKLNIADPGVITTPSSNNTTVTGVTPNGVYGYVWTVGGIGGCASTTDTVFVSNTGPISAAVARPNLDTCATGTGNTFVLYATAPTNGVGSWVQTSGPSIASFNPNTATTTVTISANGTYRFNWVVSNGVCPNNTDEVVVNFFNRASPAVITTTNTDLCGSSNGVITLNAQTPVSGTGIWSIVSGGGTISSPASPITTATLFGGSNTLRWTVSSMNGAVCPSSYDDVIVTYSPNALARDTAFCKATNALIKGSPKGTATSGTWSLISQPVGSPAITITPQGTQDSIASVGPLVSGQYTFRWTVVHPTCGTSFDDMVLTIDDVTNPNAGVDVCDTVGSPILLIGSTIPVGATATWSRFSAPSGAGLGSFTTPTSANTSYNITPIASYLPGTYNFQYQFNKGACRVSDYVQVRVISNTNAGTNIKQCNNGTFTLNGTTPSAGETGTWTKLNVGDPGTITNINLRNTTVTGINPGDSVNLIWTITTPEGCIKADTVALINVPSIVASASASATTYCDLTIPRNGLDLLGNAPTPGTGAWSVVSQPVGAPPIAWTNQNSQNANVKNLTNGTYVFRYTITNLSPCTPTTSDISITSTCAALPVKIVSFEATPAINKQVQLTWKVSAEINVEAYEIEYSNDALNFTKIGTVPATSSNNYSYLHAFPNDGHNYYRLRVIEKDSKISYSEVRNVDFRSNNAVNIYPNPSSDVVKILVNTPLQNQQSSIQIYSMDGRIIYQRVTASLKQTESIDISKLAVGTYMLKLITKDNLVNKKFEIVR